MSLTRVQIAAFIVTAAGFVKDATGYDFPNQYVDLASFIIWACFSAWGIWHTGKSKKTDDTMFLQEGGE